MPRGRQIPQNLRADRIAGTEDVDVTHQKFKKGSDFIAIKFFDAFAGIGGFRSGLEQAGGFECIGFCEIDKYAAAAYKAMYDTKGEDFYSDIKKIDTGNLRDFDLFVGGFPCQAYPEKMNIPKLTKKALKQSIIQGKFRDNIYALHIENLAIFKIFLVF